MLNFDVIFNVSPNSLLNVSTFIVLTTSVSLLSMSFNKFPCSPLINCSILLLFPPSNNLFISIPSKSIVRLNPFGNNMPIKLVYVLSVCSVFKLNVKLILLRISDTFVSGITISSGVNDNILLDGNANVMFSYVIIPIDLPISNTELIKPTLSFSNL